MGIVVLAYQEIGFVCLEALLEMGAPVDLLLTHQDDPGEEIWFRSPAALARRAGVPLLTPLDPNAPDVVETVKKIRPDFILSFYYRDLLSEDFLSLAGRGAYNLHGSLLPQYRGRAPINWAILKGEVKTGLTLHRMVRRPDAGPIVAQAEVEISESDTVRDVYARIVPEAGKLTREIWPRLQAGAVVEVPQDESRASYFGRRRPEDGRISWNSPAKQIHDLVRAVTRPYPGAFCFHKGRKLYIWSGSYDNEAGASARPGTVLETVRGRGPAVAAGRGLFFIRDASLENGPWPADRPEGGLAPGDILA
ncbi:MAG: formyltransferase [Pseudomonadota bacterium]